MSGLLRHVLDPGVRVSLVAGLFLLVAVAGCSRARPHPHPQPVPSVTASLPSTSTEEVVLPTGPVVPVPFVVEDPEHIRQIHQQMMAEAQAHFEKQEFAKVIQALERLLALHPDPEVEVEGRWTLAQAYREAGEWEGARDQYRVLASAATLTPHQQEAKRHFQELEDLLEQSRRPPHDTQAVRLSLSQLPQTEGFDEGIKRMRSDGVTTLLIDLGCGVRPMAKSEAQGGSAKTAFAAMQALLRSFVSRSHLQNLRVFIGASPRCVGFWKEPVPAEWHDRAYDLELKATKETRYFDVFHPHYQQFLLYFFDQVAVTGVDGIILLGDQPMGPYDGLSSSGIEAFQQAFQVRFLPSDIFPQALDLGQLRKPGADRVSSGWSSTQETIFWRWVGWKARERLGVLERLFHHLRRRYLALQVGLEIHPHGLTDPVRALVEYTEDAMEAARRPFSFFYVRPEIDRQSASDQADAVDKLRRISTKAVLSRLLPVLDDPRRVWVSFPAGGRKRVAPGMGQDSPILGEFPAGIGVVHDLRAFS